MLKLCLFRLNSLTTLNCYFDIFQVLHGIDYYKHCHRHWDETACGYSWKMVLTNILSTKKCCISNLSHIVNYSGYKQIYYYICLQCPVFCLKMNKIK